MTNLPVPDIARRVAALAEEADRRARRHTSNDHNRRAEEMAGFAAELRQLLPSGYGEPKWKRPCGDCGPGYQIGDEGCPHEDDQTHEIGETGVCRTCAQPIWWEPGEIGHREQTGWSDRVTRGGDSLVCFRAVHYRHVPMGAREAAIYEAGIKAGRELGPARTR